MAQRMKTRKGSQRTKLFYNPGVETVYFFKSFLNFTQNLKIIKNLPYKNQKAVCQKSL